MAAQIVLAPNTTYEIGSAKYVTDSRGRLSKAEFTINTVRPGDRVANSNDTAPIGRLGVGTPGNSDVGFHLLADVFNGSQFYPNVIPANGFLNSWPGEHRGGGLYGNLEAAWSVALANRKSVNNVEVGLTYDASSNLRPKDFSVTFGIGVNPNRFELEFGNNNQSFTAHNVGIIRNILTAARA